MMISHSALDSIVIFLGPIRVDNCNPRRYSMHVLQPVQWKYIRFFAFAAHRNRHFYFFVYETLRSLEMQISAAGLFSSGTPQ
jgi:hypothetical protein